MIRLHRNPLAHLHLLLLAGIGLIIFAALAGCAPGVENQSNRSTGTGSSSSTAGPMKMAALSDMPDDVQEAPVTVQEAYRFAVANPDAMKHIPCYCGCGAEGHTSNYSCYVTGVDEQGRITFDGHGLGCSICVDITQDAIRMFKEGKSVEQVRAAIDQTYAKYGPSNLP